MAPRRPYRRTSRSTVRPNFHACYILIDPELAEERRKTEDMVRQIREKLDQMNAKSSGMVNQFDSEGMSSNHMG